jgi:Ca-activated chloride channel family protein
MRQRLLPGLTSLMLCAVLVVGCARKAAQRHAPGEMMAADGEAEEMAMAEEEGADPSPAPPEEMAGPTAGGMGAAAAPNRNAYVTSTYMGGRGARERLAKLIEDGVTVEGKQVKLETFAGQYSQAFAIPTKTALSLTAETERGKILTKGGKTFLQVGLQAIDREAPRRPALNICLVVDHSGSMADEGKMEYARSAAVEVVNRLAATDTISLVAYDETPKVLAPAQKAKSKEALRDKLRALQPAGSTNIYSALEVGQQEVRKHLDPEAINEVILLSDGQVTAGVSELGAFGRLVAGMFDEGIQTTTIGMGLDYDEELMMAVAREGKGNYHFVRDAASINDILQDELQDLTHVVAKALRLRILLADDVKPLRVLGSAEMDEDAVAAAKKTEKIIDERVYKELGISADRQDIEDEPGLKLVIPQFYMGDSHVVMVEIEVPKGKGSRKIADVYLKYKDIVFRKNQETQQPVKIEYTTSEKAMVASIRQPVKKNILGFRTGEALQKAAALIQRGSYGEAAKVIDEQMVVLGVGAREWKDPDLDKDGELLAAYREVIGGMGTRYASDDALGEYLAKSLTYSAYQRTR